MTITDNTGVETTATVADIDWTKTTFSSYYNVRSAHGKFLITQAFTRGFWLFVANAEGKMDKASKVRGTFASVRAAQVHAASLIQVATA
jgi:hypothetical protein